MHLQPLMTIVVHATPPASLGQFPLGERKLTTFSGGSFEGVDGTDLRGTLAAGGVDWQTIRPDGAIELSAHYLLITDRDEHIEVQSDGLRIMSPEVAALFAAGDELDPDEYYFRTHVRLTTESVRLEHLNNRIAVSTGERRSDAVYIHVYQLT
jgi:hypothetical protein